MSANDLRAENRRLTKALKEREKELACLHGLARVREAAESLDELLQRAVDLIPPAWQFPKDTVGRIAMDGKAYVAGHFDDPLSRMSADVVVEGRTVGVIEVGYLKKHRDADEGPFLKEERALLDTLAKRLGHMIQRYQAIGAVRREREQLLAVFEGVDDVIYVADPDSYEVLWVNAAARKAWGDDMVGRRCYEALQNRDEPCPFCTNDKIFGEYLGRTYVWEFQNEVNKHWYRCSDKALPWHDGRMVRFELASDITDAKQAEEALSEAKEQLELAMRGSNDGIWDWNLVTNEVVFSPRWKTMLGYSEHEIENSFDAWESLVHPDDIEHAKNAIGDYLAGVTSDYAPEFRLLRKDGTWATILSRGYAVQDPETGKNVRFVGTHTDISELRKAEAELRVLTEELRTANEELERRVASRTAELQTIIDSIPGLVFYKDTENRYIRVNKFVADAHKMRKDELEGANCYDLYPPEQARAYHDDDLAVIKSGKAKLNIDEPWETDAGTRWVSTSKIPRFGDNDEVTGIIGISMDITQRKEAERELQANTVLRTGQAELAAHMRGNLTVERLCRKVIAYLCRRLQAETGLMHVTDGEGVFRPVAGYAHKHGRRKATEYRLGEGLVGQAALEQREIHLDDVPDEYLPIESGLGEARPRHVYVKPLIRADQVDVVAEFGSLGGLAPQGIELLDSMAESISLAVDSAKVRARQAELLKESQQLAEELQAQQEELRTANEELEEQAKQLKESEGRLRVQQEEMEVTNEELEEKNELLERQKRAVETARHDVEQKAEELAVVSKYKSEFLANMSHELRTPLNSLLLLSRGLADNEEGNLSREQVECAQIIHQGGNELLSLINEILDLSKIEAGRMELQVAPCPVAELADSTLRQFGRAAEEKGLSLLVTVDDKAPEIVECDRQRLEQIIRNLVANAIKFTEHGSVSVLFSPYCDKDDGDATPGAEHISISVSDTGMGIAPEQQRLIFEAFQQGDGSTARKYGGTGLGLSISRELAMLMGGRIEVESEPGRGTRFVLVIPVAPVSHAHRVKSGPPTKAPRAEEEQQATHQEASIPDDRDSIAPGDRVMLIIEDDERFARILQKRCGDRGFKCLVALSGEEGLDIATRHKPNGIVLDIRLPGMDGWSVLDRIKGEPSLRHIPVHVMSAEDPTPDGLGRGAIGHIKKPVAAEDIDGALARIEELMGDRPRRVLIVEDDAGTRRGIAELIGDHDVQTDEVSTIVEARKALGRERYDCMVLDLHVGPDDGRELLSSLSTDSGIAVPPVVVYTGSDLTSEDEMELRAYSDSIIIKGVRSEERLLDEVSLFLHRVVADMPEQKRRVITNLHDTDALLRDRKVLIVDDDMRTVFALAKLLADRGMNTLKAENGEKALELLVREGDVDLVLMDIMMPVMDGYETTRRIRQQDAFRQLPIIALTAKAMPGDRNDCLSAGASDYLTKPVDAERLISMIRVWLYR